MKVDKSLYLAWKSPLSKRWHVVGCLENTTDGYEFAYTRGAMVEGFIPFGAMSDLSKKYFSSSLFPQFKNRILSPGRPEYERYLTWLSLSKEEATDMNLLAMSSGTRGTDDIRLFRNVDISNGVFEISFFLHGTSFMRDLTPDVIRDIKLGEVLYPLLDCRNEFDPDAVMLRTDNPTSLLGYVPGYLAKRIGALAKSECDVNFEVEALNDDAPISYRLLCRCYGKVSSDFKFDSDEGEYLTL